VERPAYARVRAAGPDQSCTDIAKLPNRVVQLEVRQHPASGRVPAGGRDQLAAGAGTMQRIGTEAGVPFMGRGDGTTLAAATVSGLCGAMATPLELEYGWKLEQSIQRLKRLRPKLRGDPAVAEQLECSIVTLRRLLESPFFAHTYQPGLTAAPHEEQDWSGERR
jgi:hypothetical protein